MADKRTLEQQHADFVKRTSQDRSQQTKLSSPQAFGGQGVDIETIDRTFLNFIDNYIDASVKTNKGYEKVKVLFSSKERWASLRNHEGIRDSHGRLILPLITITRVSNEVDQESHYSELNDISIFKRVNPKTIYSRQHRDYEDTLAGKAKPREIDFDELPLYDFVSFPGAKSIKLVYEVIFWADYMSQSNSIFEYFVNNINRKMDYIFSEEGFYFPVQLSSVTNDTNIEEYTDDERVIRQTMNFDVSAYLVDKEKIKYERSAIKLSLKQENVVRKSDAEDIFDKTLGLNRKIF